MQKENTNTTNFTTVLAGERIVENDDIEQESGAEQEQSVIEQESVFGMEQVVEMEQHPLQRNDQNFIGFAIKRFKKFLPQFIKDQFEEDIYEPRQLNSLNKTLNSRSFQTRNHHLGQKHFNTLFGIGKDNSSVKKRNQKNRLVMRKIIEKKFLALVFESSLSQENYSSYLQKMLQMHYKLLDADYFAQYHQEL